MSEDPDAPLPEKVQGYIDRLKPPAGDNIYVLDAILADIEAEPRGSTCLSLQLTAIGRVAQILLEKAVAKMPNLYREYP